MCLTCVKDRRVIGWLVSRQAQQQARGGARPHLLQAFLLQRARSAQRLGAKVSEPCKERNVLNGVHYSSVCVSPVVKTYHRPVMA